MSGHYMTPAGSSPGLAIAVSYTLPLSFQSGTKVKAMWVDRAWSCVNYRIQRNASEHDASRLPDQRELRCHV